jgi:hypothetical protein
MVDTKAKRAQFQSCDSTENKLRKKVPEQNSHQSHTTQKTFSETLGGTGEGERQ